MSEGTKLSIPTGLQILLSDLDFLGQITRGQKACITNRVIVDGNTWSGAFYRSMKGENRLNTINKIEQIVNQTVDAIESHKNTSYLEIIINYFSYARNGIDALNSTYQSDPDMRARLNVQLKNIDLQLNQYRHLIKGYSESGSWNSSKEFGKDFSSSKEFSPDTEPKQKQPSQDAERTDPERGTRRRRRKGDMSESQDL